MCAYNTHIMCKNGTYMYVLELQGSVGKITICHIEHVYPNRKEDRALIDICLCGSTQSPVDMYVTINTMASIHVYIYKISVSVGL